MRARAETKARADKVAICIACASHRIQHYREKGGQEDYVFDLRVSNAKPQNAQWNPREWWNRSDEFDDGVYHFAKPVEPPHGETEGHTKHGCDSNGHQHAT
jgi:hypothetical protein